MLISSLATLLVFQAAKLPPVVGPLAAQGGAVTYQRGKAKPVPVPFRYSARVGDLVEIGEGSRASLFVRANGRRYTIESGSKFRVDKSGVVVLAGPPPRFILLAATPSDPTAPKRLTMSTTIRGGDRGIAPYGAIRQGEIVLTWPIDPAASKLLLELLSLDGKRLREFPLAADATSFTVPPEAVRSGEWIRARLSIECPSSPTVVRETQVRALSKTERTRLAAAESTLAAQKEALGADYEWSRAELFAAYGLVAEMEASWRAGLVPQKLTEDAAPAQRELGELYETAGFRAEALAAYAGARKAGDGDPELESAILRLGGSSLSDADRAEMERDVLMKAAKWADALPPAQKAADLRIKENPDSTEAGRALQALGRVQYSLMRPEEAAQSFNGSLAILEKTLGPVSPEVAVCLNHLGIIAFRQSRHEEAERYLRRALAIYERNSPESLSVASVREAIGAIAFRTRRLDEAQRMFEAALAVREKIAPNSLDIAHSLSNLAGVAAAKSQLDLAQRRLEQALAIQQRLAPDSPEIAAFLGNLGNVADRRGNPEEAQSYFERALSFQERIAPGSLVSAGLLNNLGNLARDRGRLDQAQDYHERALAIREKLAPGSLDVARSLSNLGNVAESQGRMDEAERLYRRVVEIHQRLAPESLEYAATLSNLGSMAIQKGNLDEAKAFIERSLAIREKQVPDSLDVATGLGHLGAISFERGRYEEAKGLIERALAIRRKVAPQSLEIAADESALSDIAYATGRYDEAQQRLETALGVQERFAPGSLGMARLLFRLGNVAARQGDEKAVRAILDKTRDNLLAFAGREAGNGSDLPTFERYTSQLLSSVGAVARSGFEESAYRSLANLRGLRLALESRARITERSAGSDESLRRALAERDRAVEAESRWVQARTAKMPDQQFEDGLVERRALSNQKREEAARLLKAKDPRLATTPEVTTEAVRTKLSSAEALIEYVRVQGSGVEKGHASDRYGAFVVTASAPPRYVLLGTASAIDSQVKRFGGLLAGDDEKACRKCGQALYAALIEPLGKLPENLLVTPDGLLNGLPFNALVDGKGKYLIETKAVSVAGGGRDLVERPATGEAGPPVVLAGPSYDVDPDVQAQAVRTLGTSVDSAVVPTRGASAGRFAPLAGATAEGGIVGKALGVQPVTGDAATEEALYAVRRPRVLHIATHGEFFPPVQSEKAVRASLESSGGLGARLAVADNPMLRSALVFAGANDADKLREKGVNDGWATALEISQMDLAGTELVVLSGCETGLGDYRVGEGVYGLQRAFRFAGAQTLVMSLFSVPDDATQRLMAGFYAGWKPGMPRGSKLKSLREAQLALLRDPKTRSPRDWAGFVLMGDR